MTRPTDISPLARLVRRVDAVAAGEPPTDAVSSGFPSVDRALGGGFRRGDLVVLGGETSAGKSCLTQAMALRIAQAGVEAAFLSHEMTVERLLERALAMEGRCRIDDLRSGTLTEAARTAVGAAAVRLRERPPHLEPLVIGGVETVREALRRDPRARVVFVDPLEALGTGTQPRDGELATMTLALKRLALEFDAAVVVTTQTARTTADRNDRRPGLEDFGALGVLRQAADIVLGLYREEMFHPHSGVDGATELLLLKNRNGKAGYVDLYFYEHCLRFEDLLDPDH